MLMVATVSAPQAGLTGLLASWSIKVPPDLLRFHAGMFGSSTLGSLNRHLDALLVAPIHWSLRCGGVSCCKTGSRRVEAAI